MTGSAAPARLYRAAPTIAPHFGFGSYWTRSEAFARHFQQWAADTLGHAYVVYRANVDLTGHHEISGRRDSHVMTACAPLFANEGYRWLSFLEHGSAEGLHPEFSRLVAAERQFVYLGTEPLPTLPATA